MPNSVWRQSVKNLVLVGTLNIVAGFPPHPARPCWTSCPSVHCGLSKLGDSAFRPPGEREKLRRRSQSCRTMPWPTSTWLHSCTLEVCSWYYVHVYPVLTSPRPPGYMYTYPVSFRENAIICLIEISSYDLRMGI